MAAMDKLDIFCGHKNWKIEVYDNSHFTIASPTILNSAGYFTEI